MFSTTLLSSDPARSQSPICPIILTKVPDLKEICAVTVTIGLWNHVNVPLMLWSPYSTRMAGSYGWQLTSVTEKIKNSTRQLPVPKSVADYLNTYVGKMRYQIQDWVAYHHRAIFFNDGSDFHLYHHIPYFTWYPDGTINYKETARNLLSSLRLSEVEKYKFLCTYCLTDELMRLVYLLFMDNVVEFVNSTSHPLIFYWNHYFKNTLYQIPVLPNMSLDKHMFQQQRVDNWWAKEYFFNRLNSQEKVQAAIALIDQLGVWYQKLILLKLNETERVNVYMQRAATILSNYSKTGTCAREIISTWYDIRNLIDEQRFVSILEMLLDSPNANAVLTEIWISACDDFKCHVSSDNEYRVIGKIFLFQTNNIDDNEFLFTVLSDLNVDVKKSIIKMKFFTDYCNALLLKSKLSVFERLIKNCLPIPTEELEQFKREFIITSVPIKAKCLEHYLAERVNLVNNFLTELLPSRPDLVQYKIDLLMKNYNNGATYSLTIVKTRVLELMIADCLPTADLKTAFRKRIIFSPSSISNLQEMLTDHNKFDFLKKYVEYYLPSEEDRKELKKRLVTNFENKLAVIFSKCGLNVIDTILRWCLENDQGLLEYKSSLNVDILFDKILTNAIFMRHDFRLSRCTFRKQFEFVYVELFLNWYFESADRVRQYKLLQIDSYTNISVVKTLLKKKDESQLKIVMKWFFDNDPEEIEKFRKRHAGAGKILYVI